LNTLKSNIQALIFCAQAPVAIEDLQKCLSEVMQYEVTISDVLESIEEINEQLAADDFAFQIYAIGGGYQFLTKPDYQDAVGLFLKQKSKRKLSASSLETLAIIAYKQPISKSGIEQIRGVSCDYAIQKLLEKELIQIKGKAETIGRPIIYGTTQKFMDYFGINHLKDLPQLKDFVSEENAIGEISEN
jgi:segregation and condensation protein B